MRLIIEWKFTRALILSRLCLYFSQKSANAQYSNLALGSLPQRAAKIQELQTKEWRCQSLRNYKKVKVQEQKCVWDLRQK